MTYLRLLLLLLLPVFTFAQTNTVSANPISISTWASPQLQSDMPTAYYDAPTPQSPTPTNALTSPAPSTGSDKQRTYVVGVAVTAVIVAICIGVAIYVCASRYRARKTSARRRRYAPWVLRIVQREKDARSIQTPAHAKHSDIDEPNHFTIV